MKHLFLMLVLIGSTLPVYGETLKRMRNPYTGKTDYYTKLSSATLPSGSTYYVQTNPSGEQGVSVNVSCMTASVFFVGMKTLAQLKTITPSTTGQLYFCQDCGTDALCVATGTANQFSFGRVSARTTPCQ